MTTTRGASPVTPSIGSAPTACTDDAIHESSRVRLTNPGPLTSIPLHTPVRSSAASTRVATSRGGIPRRLASGNAKLACRSANWLGRSTGSAPRNSSPNAVAIAAETKGASVSCGEGIPQG
jgi:hypothetical protein